MRNLVDEFVKLQEQKYRTKKMYYHISPSKFTSFKSKNNFRKNDKDLDSMAGVFLSPNMYMIRRYALDYLEEKYRKEDFYIYNCVLNRDLNIFNPSSKIDRTAFLDYLRDSNKLKDFFFNYGIKSYRTVFADLQKELGEIFKTHQWERMENPEMIKVIKALNYEGFVSVENRIGNIMVFDANNVDIISNNKSAPYRKVNTIELEQLTSKELTTEEYRQIKLRGYEHSGPGHEYNLNRAKIDYESEMEDLKYITDDEFKIMTDNSDVEFDILRFMQDGKIQEWSMWRAFEFIEKEKRAKFNKVFFRGEEYDSLDEIGCALIEMFGVVKKNDEVKGVINEPDTSPVPF